MEIYEVITTKLILHSIGYDQQAKNVNNLMWPNRTERMAYIYIKRKRDNNINDNNKKTSTEKNGKNEKKQKRTQKTSIWWANQHQIASGEQWTPHIMNKYAWNWLRKLSLVHTNQKYKLK